MEQTQAVIEVRDLKISFGDQPVLNGLNLDLYEGENLVVLGKSGSGKSVLIKCIVQLLQADSGSIKVFGKEMNNIGKKDLEELRKDIGFLFQSGALYDSMTVRQNLEFPLRRIRKELDEKQIEAKVQEVLANVGLPDTADKMPSQLSGGMKKRIGLARTIIVDPKILLYDEPTTGLDPITSDEISQLMNAVKKQYKTSSIIITHDIACVKTVADRIIMINDGILFKEGTYHDFTTSKDPFISSYFN
ncbi:MAG TPA: ATP-binding cassette domain-containing protein [Catalimonadaceae bacterium]|nr:ATP-binding cassette domain-containing protein [Catalimonadaceae bacterium]HPI09403.1 ATP-binding cassette domain-containing protein [Catalimonadaceae bacterium]